MPIYIVTIGIFILTSAFSYSVIASRETTNSQMVDADTTASKEVLSIMDNDMDLAMFLDGTYRSDVRYEVPYGYIEPMSLEITIANGVVTNSQVDFDVVNPVSGDYVRSFERYYKKEVIGQPITEISLARIGGASLTNVAFDAALEKIKVDAVGGMMAANSDDKPLPLLLPGTLTKEGIVLSARPNTQISPVQGVSVSQVDPAVEDSKNTTVGEYKDGTYVVELAYYAWTDLYEPMQTSITLEDGIIVAAEQRYATIDYSHSIQYQQHFDSLYKAVVIGMPLANAPIARVGQASETTDGFNEALAAIQQEAQK